MGRIGIHKPQNAVLSAAIAERILKFRQRSKVKSGPVMHTSSRIFTEEGLRGMIMGDSHVFTGDSDPVTRMSVFQIINADVTIRPAGRSFARRWAHAIRLTYHGSFSNARIQAFIGHNILPIHWSHFGKADLKQTACVYFPVWIRNKVI